MLLNLCVAISFFNSDCLDKIMEVFVDTRTRNAVIKRMIQLGLIADRSEVLPSKRKKSRKSMPSNESDDNGDSESSDDDDALDTRRYKVTVKNITKKNSKTKGASTKQPRKLTKISFDANNLKRIITECGDDVKQHFDWIQESLNDAAEDAEDASEDPDDGVPLVPFTGK